jgi:Phage Mu protein F like protein
MPSRLLQVLRRLLRAGREHEDAAADRQRAILLATRNDLLAALAVLPPESYRAAQLTALLLAVDRVLDPRRAEALRYAADDTRTAWTLARGQAEATITLPSVPSVSITADLLQAVIDVTEDQLREVWSELGSGLKVSIRRVALGAQTPEAAMAAVQALIRDPKTFGSAATRAEVIVRTETNRTYNVAADARFRELNATFDGQLRKAWLATNDTRTRPSHRDAGRQYDRAHAIPVTEPFIVGGHPMRYPLDPLAPAREVVACRCRAIAIPPDIEESEWLDITEESLYVEEEARA